MIPVVLLNKTAKTKASLFLHVVGNKVLDVYNNFQFKTENDKMMLDKICEKFETYCILKINFTKIVKDNRSIFDRAEEQKQDVRI